MSNLHPNFVPQPGMALEGPGIEIIAEAILRRQRQFEEPLQMSVALILNNIGDRFVPLECEGKEWRGFKKDLARDDLGRPTMTCPNGHDLLKGQSITVGWVMKPE